MVTHAGPLPAGSPAAAARAASENSFYVDYAPVEDPRAIRAILESLGLPAPAAPPDPP